MPTCAGSIELRQQDANTWYLHLMTFRQPGRVRKGTSKVGVSGRSTSTSRTAQTTDHRYCACSLSPS